MPRGYVCQMLCFPSTHPLVPDVLKTGLRGVVADIYFQQDLSDAIEYAAIKEQHFPPSAFAVPEIIPPDTQPPFANPAPVFRARLSLVKAGFILCVAVHHCTTDITGFGALLKIWASHRRTEASVVAGFDPSWLDRTALLGRPNATIRPAPTSIPELLHVQGPSDLARFASLSSHPDDLTTSIFFFPQKILQALKRAINEHIAAQGTADWVSTSDILTALLWSATLRAEQAASTSGLNPATGAKSSNTIGFPVNFRSRFNPPISPDYLGAAFIMTTATALREELISFATSSSPTSSDAHLDSTSISKPAKIASAIRTSLRLVDEENIRDVLTYLDAVSTDYPPIILGPQHDGISIVS
ncbi:hypothetical protein AAE478_002173 [Parahypoxylon ruwenzoriense]